MPSAWQRLHLARSVALKIWKEVDPVSRETTAWHLEWLRSVDRPIYMDGRPHPSPNARAHLGGILDRRVGGRHAARRVTHLKEEYLKRNGVWHSDKIELTQYLIRRGDYLTYLVIAYDPVYLSEPLVRSTEYRLNVNQQIPPYPCTVVNEVDRPEGRRAALPAGHEQRHHLVLAPLRHPDGRRERRCREHVSGDPREDPALDGWIRSGAAPAASNPAQSPASGAARRAAVEPCGSDERQICGRLRSAIAVATQTPLIGQSPTVAPSGLVKAPTIQPPPAGEIEILPVRGNIYALMGAGANIIASVGADGVLLVDAGTAAMTDKIVAALAQLQREWSARNEPKPPRMGSRDAILSCRSSHRRAAQADSLHREHRADSRSRRRQREAAQCGHARSPAATSPAIFATREKAPRSWRTRTSSIRLSHAAEGQPAPPADALPTDTYFTDYYKLSHFFNGEGVQLLHMPKANTDGDSIVYFRGSDVIALGDLMATESYPVFDVEKGGSINGIIDGLNAVLDLAITEFRLEGGTMMVPGHGRLVDSGDVAYYRDMLTIIRDRIQDMVSKEMTLDEVKAARPTADYDTEYGNTPGWTSDMFIEAVYKSLGGGRTPPRPARAPARRGGQR